MLNNSVFKRFTQGFTLIELLIVVAIIAILAAIAVPNFLEAQTRAKVSRVMSDLRTYDTAMEMYRIDHNKPSPTYRSVAPETRKWIVHYLTTPIAYMNQALPDPFNTNATYIQNLTNGVPDPDQRYLIAWGPDHLHSPRGVYNSARETQYARYFQLYPTYSDGSKLLRKNFVFFFSLGPDRVFDILEGSRSPVAIYTYDATNGTISNGEIGRFNG
jgi:prepilin-type N-terminal cleavage/methylation domain-containing protein